MGEISKIQLLWSSPRLINNCQNSTVVFSTTVDDVRSLKADNANLIN
ncbi:MULTISPECIES: hypothetical protein [unclassified Snodgrassella]|nr:MULTISPECIES: hypothetical protein [unclassified Snodgrassella]MBI0068867.1 hypothetical protein [Snodgrassella sp. M0110]MBI0077396.1 hypothetical protein [Snodgrassella sp. M0118]MBI0079801.1 hypothetical protein [Snodgrassella sp. M0112]